MKVYNEEEYKKTLCKKNRPILSEQYEIKFWFKKEDGFWEQQIAEYRTEDKGMHDAVYLKWKEEYRNAEVKHVTTIYI